MKKLVSILSFALLSVISVHAVASEDPASEKTKSYSKSYPVNSGDKIKLDNSFGEMKISTWSKNEIKVDVNITVQAGTDERAQRILDAVHIEDSKSGSDISFKTHIKGDDNDRDKENWKDRNEKTSFKINYTVMLPANATLDATNQFGTLNIGDFDGPATLSCKFGTMTAGKISQAKKIDIQFADGSTVESMNNGNLNIQFSRAQVNKLSGDITAHINQSSAKIPVSNSLKKLDLHNDFSNVYLDADKGLSADFSIKTSFGDFTNKSDFTINRNRENENRWFNSNESYSGKAGSGTLDVVVRSSFGHTVLGHNLSFDVNEKSDKSHKWVKDKADKDDKDDRKEERKDRKKMRV